MENYFLKIDCASLRTRGPACILSLVSGNHHPSRRWERPPPMIKTIRIQTRNNSDARNFRLLGDLAEAKHSGGKIVIARVEESDLAEVEALLDDSHMVASYEIG